MFQLVIAITVPVIFSFFCSIAEAALYSVPISYVEKLRKEGSKNGEVLHLLRSNIEAPITAVLTLNTIASIAGAAVAGAVASEVLASHHAVAIFTVVFTVCILFIAEIVPKSLGVNYARVLAPILAQPIYWLTILMRPVIMVSGLITRLITPFSKGAEATVEDIQAIVSLSHRSGEIKAFEECYIRNILTLDEKTAADVMTPRTVVFSLPGEKSVADAEKDPQFQYFSRIPVYHEDKENIIGVVRRREIMQELAEDRHDTLLNTICKPAHFVLATHPLDKLLHDFLAQRTHLFIVIDEFGGLDGLVSLEDVLEEILGQEIVEESDPTPDLRKMAQEKKEHLLRALEKNISG